MIGRLSLRARLLAALGVVALTVLVVTDFAVYTAVRSYLYQQADNQLQRSHHALEQAATSDSPADRPGAQSSGTETQAGNASAAEGSSSFCAFGRESAPGMFIAVLRPSDAPIASEVCPAYVPGSKPLSPVLPTRIEGFARSASDPHELVVYFTAPATSTGATFQVRASKLAGGGTLIVADPIEGIASTLARLFGIELVVTSAALVGAIFLGLLLVRLGLRPLRDVERTADAISGGTLMHRVPNPNPHTEVGHVATALNVMLERLETAFSELQASEIRLRRFVGDASHELRTPIAAVSAYTQLFRQGAASHAEDLARAMAGIERESDRMGRLIGDLLTLARLDEHRTLSAEPVELIDLATEAIETARTVGPGWPVSLSVEDVVEVAGDRVALRQVLDNLLANVRAHTPEGTEAVVRVARVGREAVIEVADKGPGLTAEEAARVFERFFRIDPSRARSTGGSGLGLAIVASIVQAHSGHATAAPGPNGGAVFRVTLPAIDEGGAGE